MLLEKLRKTCNVTRECSWFSQHILVCMRWDGLHWKWIKSHCYSLQVKSGFLCYPYESTGALAKSSMWCKSFTGISPVPILRDKFVICKVFFLEGSVSSILPSPIYFPRIYNYSCVRVSNLLTLMDGVEVVKHLLICTVLDVLVINSLFLFFLSETWSSLLV